MVPRQLHSSRQGIVKIWVCDSIFSTNRLSDDDLVDIVEFVPILWRINQIDEPSFVSMSRYNGSNFGPPGIATFNAFAVKNDCLSKR
jgi:hypothetical protein